jgi:hypothetical protein
MRDRSFGGVWWYLHLTKKGVLFSIFSENNKEAIPQSFDLWDSLFVLNLYAVGGI